MSLSVKALRAVAALAVCLSVTGHLRASTEGQSEGRSGHTVTAVSSDQVLIAGGDAAGTAEFKNLVTGEVTPLGRMATRRAGHSAIQLANGNVLIVGGYLFGTSNIEQSAEVFDLATRRFSKTAGSPGKRLQPVLTLRDDGIVIVRGGDALETTRLFDPATGRFTADPTAATITTDRADYKPGEIVTFTGRNWQPGELVAILLRETPTPAGDVELFATADAGGEIMNNLFAPEARHLGVTFEVTARGADSGRVARTVFTDGPLMAAIYTVQSIAGLPMPSGGTFIGACDDCEWWIDLPFPVTFYDQEYLKAAVFSNGVFQLGPVTGRDYSHVNGPLPASGFGPSIFPFWDDLNLDEPGHGVFMSVEGTAPERAVTIEWRGRHWNDTRLPVNFALRIYESLPMFDVVYATTAAPAGMAVDNISATVGLQKTDSGPTTVWSQSSNGFAPGAGLRFIGHATPTTTTASSITITSKSPVPQAINLSASVTGIEFPLWGSSATGKVDFFLDGAYKGSTNVNRDNYRAVTLTLNLDPTVGTHSITARYSGWNAFLPSEGFGTLLVKPIPTTTTLSGPATATYGQSITLSGRAKAGTQDLSFGAIQFRDGVVLLGQGNFGTFPFASVASFPISTLAPGVHSLTATYVPPTGAAWGSSTSSVLQVVVSQPQATVTWGTIAAISAGTPLGNTQLDATADAAGTFAYTPPAGTVLQPGTHQLSVTFTPSDGALQASTLTNTITVTNAPPTASAGLDQQFVVGSPCSVSVTLNGSGTDPENGSLTYLWTGPFGPASASSPTVSNVGLGTHTFSLQVIDPFNLSSPADTVDVTVSDNSPPTFILPPSINAHQSVPAGAMVTLPAVTGTDNCGGPVAITASRASGLFPVGTTLVTYTATDARGNIAPQRQLAVTVTPAVPPAFSSPALNTAFSAVPGTPLSFTVRADDADTNGTVVLGATGLPAGASFPIPAADNPASSTFTWTPGDDDSGTHTVTFTAVDNAGLAAQALTVTITVAWPPAFSEPFTAPAGSCICTPLLMNTNGSVVQRWYVRASGGPLTVTAAAVSVNNVGSGTVRVRAFDGTPGPVFDMAAQFPTGTAPGQGQSQSATIEAVAGEIYQLFVTTPNSANQGHFKLKILGGDSLATVSPSAPSFEHTPTKWYFNVGEGETLDLRLISAGTPAAATTASYTLTAPNGTSTTGSASATNASLGLINGGAVAGVWSLALDPQEHYRLEKTSGADRGLYLRWDSAGSGELTVRVSSPTPGGPAFPYPVTLTMLDAQGQVIGSGAFSGPDDVSGLPAGSYTLQLGGLPPGWTAVSTSIVFDVFCDTPRLVEFVVTDITPPLLTMPGNATLEASSAAGAAHAFAVTAADEADPDVTIVCSATSGGVFPLGPNDSPGMTTVSCTATDDAGNASTGSFTVTVQDTTRPVLTMPADAVLEATGAAGTTHTFATLAVDTVDSSVPVTCSAPVGGTFALGETLVTCTATDNAGNQAVGAFAVTVRDTTAPSGSCVAGVNPSLRNVPRASRQNEDGFFQVRSSDLVTSAPTIALGSFTLQQGETIKLTQSPGTAGVVFVGTMGPGAIRHFRIGPGDPILTITDAAGNGSTLVCYVPPVPK